MDKLSLKRKIQGRLVKSSRPDIMKPPICCICHSPAGKEGGLVKFADYTPLPPKMVGHPHGLAWCCGKHLSAAEALVHLSTADAIAALALS